MMSITLQESNNIIDKKIKEIATNIKNLKKNNITNTKTNNNTNTNNDYNNLLETIKQKDNLIYYMNMKLVQSNNIINYQQQIINNTNNKSFNNNIYLDDKYYNKIKKYIKHTTNKNIKGIILNNDGQLEYHKLKRK